MDIPFDHLEVAQEAASILAGKHPHWIKRGDPEASAQQFLNQMGRSHGYVLRFAEDMVARSPYFAEQLGVTEERVLWMAEQARAGEAHARSVALARAARRAAQQ